MKLGNLSPFLLSLLAGLFSPAPVAAADLVLFDFTRPFDAAQVGTTDAQLAAADAKNPTGLRFTTFHGQPWPGVTLKAPAGHWDLSGFGQVVVRLRNTGTNSATVFCRVDNSGADGVSNCVTHSITLPPGEIRSLTVELKRAVEDRLGGKLFGLRGYPVRIGSGASAIDPRNVTQLLLFLGRPKEDHSFAVQEIRATGTYAPPTASVTDADPFFPFIDTFGQYHHRDWPGKVHSLEELRARRETEAKELAARPAPKGWDQYGGWAEGPKLAATGFFRTQKVEGKWWLVDPDGRLFFSHGIDCVRMFDSTPIDERTNWFENFPGQQPEFVRFHSHGYALKGHYAGRSPETFSFFGANLLRKYGTNWNETYSLLVHQRLRSWGINTIANWSDWSTRRLRRTPYTDSIGSHGVKQIEGSEGYWGKFPDVFDPAFAEAARRQMEGKRQDSAGDPWCLGYFSDNEMSWGDEVSLAVAALRSPSGQAAKQALLQDLKAKYGEIAKLNTAWGTQHESWEALAESREAPDRAKAKADLEAFYTRTAEQYFRTTRDAIKAIAPQQLYLGCRFAWVNSRAAAAAAKYCDVVSYNLYQRSVADFRFNGGADVPLIIGEFHFGALDRGLFHTGLVPVADQRARAKAYREYVLGARRHPQFVGCHWFQYCDEPVTGRVYDEENYQIGFVDVADTPYAETVDACREVAGQLYGK